MTASPVPRRPWWRSWWGITLIILSPVILLVSIVVAVVTVAAVGGDIVVIYLGERWMIGEVDEHGVDVTAVCSDTIGYRRYALGSGLTSDREIASAVERWRRDVLGYGDVR